MSEKIILQTDPESATYRTDIKGWVSRTGLFYGDGGDSERLARWEGRTHDRCECGAIFEKTHSTICESCRDKKDRERYEKLELVEWDEKTPLCIYRDDTYFMSADDIFFHCEEYGCKSHDLMLVLCERVEPNSLDPENMFHDQLSDADIDIPDSIYAAADEFNEIVKEHFPVLWIAGNKRVKVEI